VKHLFPCVLLLVPSGALGAGLDAGVDRGPSFSFSPRIAPLAGNETNVEWGFGASFTAHPLSFFAVEGHISGFPTGGAANTSPRTLLELEEATTNDAVESVDRVALATLGALFVPASGLIAPQGAPEVQAEFLVGIAGGVEVTSIENLVRRDGEPDLLVDPEVHARGVVSGLVGARLVPHPVLGFRFDVRWMVGAESVLDYTTEESAIVNRSLPEGATANRLDCGGSRDAVCRLAPYGAVSLEFALEITLGAKSTAAGAASTTPDPDPERPAACAKSFRPPPSRWCED